MSDIIVAFSFRNKNYLWFIDHHYVGLISFIISTIILHRLKIRAEKARKLKNITKIRPGGDVIDICLQPDTAYKVISEKLKNAIISMLGIKTPGRYFISPSVLFTGYSVVMTGPIKEYFLNVGARVLITNINDVLKQIALGSAASLAVYQLVVPFLVPLAGAGEVFTSIIVALIILLKSYTNIPCNDWVAILPSMVNPLPSTEVVHYLPEPHYKDTKAIEIYVRSNKDVPIHEFVTTDEQKCVVNEGQNEKSLIQSCYSEKTTKKINDNVLTLDDVKKLDSTGVRKVARPLYDRHKLRLEKHKLKQERFKAKRLAIMEGRKNTEKLTRESNYEEWKNVAQGLI